MSEKTPDESDIYYSGDEDDIQSNDELVELLSNQVEVLIKELDAGHKKLLRVSAEFDNYQKRAKKDKLRAEQGVTRKMLLSLLPAFDHLDSVMAHSDELPDTFKEGLRLIHEGFLKSLADYDVACFVPEIGSAFDPEVHCAISIQPSDAAEQETVGQVIRAGYALGNNVLRPADVIVHKKM